MEKEEKIAYNSLHGISTPGADKGPDIFWLMGWADWQIEADFLENKEDKS